MKGSSNLVLLLFLWTPVFGNRLLLPVVRNEELVPEVSWEPTSCYKRQQFCCYKYTKCGHYCETKYCTQKSICVSTRLGACIQWKAVQTCETKCYDKMCVLFECTPLDVVKEPTYVSPQIHSRVYTPEGSKAPEPTITPPEPPPSPSPNSSFEPQQFLTTQQQFLFPSSGSQLLPPSGFAVRLLQRPGQP